VIVDASLDEGLGMLLFRYSSGYSLAQRTNSKLYIVNHTSQDLPRKVSFDSNDHRNFLEYFTIKYDKFITPEEGQILK
jgi:hypothetical protein